VLPGAALADRGLEDNARIFAKTFYVRQPIEEVVAFYEKNKGPMEEVRPGQEYRNVVRHPPRYKASDEPDLIGVLVFSAAPVENDPERSVQRMQDAHHGIIPDEAMETLHDRCRSKHFENLRTMVHMLDHYNWSDFEEVCSRFGHVEWAYFQPTDEIDQQGRRMSMDQILLVEHQKNLGMVDQEMDPAAMESFFKHMLELQLQGRSQEVDELVRQLEDQILTGMQMDRQGPLDKWNEWLEYLSRLDQHAYRTMIIIHLDPSSWPDGPGW
jgi:phage anti-repressor protein